MLIPYINPSTKNILEKIDTKLLDSKTGEIVAPIVKDIPRFVKPESNYATSFGWQWNKWESIRNVQAASGFGLDKTIRKRTKFDGLNTQDKTILECGCGGGDDTKVLCSFPFSEIYSFDLSNSVERSSRINDDTRIQLSQASIYEIPYPDNSFDFVYCHRVLQHTPDPIQSLKFIASKVKPGGFLFAHAYKQSPEYMAEWRYKYLPITRKLPLKLIYYYVELFGLPFHYLNQLLYRFNISRKIAYRYIPFYRKALTEDARHMSTKHMIELEKLITFDALTPAHDHPMTSESFFGTIAECGFEIINKHDPEVSPLWCTAKKITK
jgi:ubiquinone/menaquinone biosynthesis C-methylase UbiE